MNNLEKQYYKNRRVGYFRKDLTNKRFGMLLAVKFSEMRGHYSWWECLCDCGKTWLIKSTSLTSKNTQSCGCLYKKKMSENGKKRIKHGQYRTPTWLSWRAMRGRCLNEKDPAYMRYGGRGITVCERWLDFENFLADMGERPKGLSIDRINNEGNYEPENCKWSTSKEQNNNRRPKRIIRGSNGKTTAQQKSQEHEQASGLCGPASIMGSSITYFDMEERA